MAPVKRLTKKQIGLQQRPWITPDTMSAINERNKFYKGFIEEKRPDSKIDKYNSYKAQRNIVTSRRRKAKKDYYNTFFEENRNNVKETWKGIRNLINVTKKTSTNIGKIAENGKETTNPVEIADALNTFYVNIGKSVEQQQREKHHILIIYETEIFLTSLLTTVLLRKLENIYPAAVSKASGPNSVPIPILKSTIDHLIEPVMYILNKSLAEGTFPDQLKLASICPIYKKIIALNVLIINQFRCCLI